MSSHPVVGIDVGATWVKSAVVRPADGVLLSPPHRVRTPRPATPWNIGRTVAAAASALTAVGPVGVTLPCTVEAGVTRSASNVDATWVDLDALAMVSRALGHRDVAVLNDADAAGAAEAACGAARGVDGTVVVLTFGTGLGSAVLLDGRLLPHSELGQLRMADGVLAEHHVGSSVRRGPSFDWIGWSRRVNGVLHAVDALLRPDLVVIGGGVSAPEDAPRWKDLVSARMPVVSALLGNNAGVIGAAMAGSGADIPGVARIRSALTARPAGAE